MAERLLEADTAGVKQAYEDFDINRPPFRFPSREPKYQPDPAYSEVDESAIFEMEYKLFHPEENFPRPPEFLADGHPVLESWKKLTKAREEFMAGVDMIRSVKHHLKARKSVDEPHQVQKTLAVVDPGGKGGLERLERTLRERHLEEKKAYFQRAMCYLHLYQACPDFEGKDPLAADLLDEAELIYLGHVGYAAVRSAAHKFGRVREDGTLVMDHCYKTSVYVINRYLEELRNEKDPKKRRKLYNQAKKGVLVAIPHDYIEDFTKLSPHFLEDKLIQQATWHTDIEGDLRSPGYPDLPQRSNFFSRNKKSILQMLAALTKPQPKDNPLRKGYLERQVLNEWEGSIDDQVLVFRSKVGDRLHNLRTVGIKPVEKQAEYMIETGKIIDLGKKIGEKAKRQSRLAPDLLSLCMASVEISTNLITVIKNTGTIESLSGEIERIQNLTNNAVKN